MKSVVSFLGARGLLGGDLAGLLAADMFARTRPRRSNTLDLLLNHCGGVEFGQITVNRKNSRFWQKRALNALL